MTNLEQAKRLKEAGWKFKHCKHDDGSEEMCVHCRYILQNDRCLVFPDEKEMMEFLFKNISCIVPNEIDGCWHLYLTVRQRKGKYIDNEICNSDITECLVQACVKVLKTKQAKEEGR